MALGCGSTIKAVTTIRGSDMATPRRLKLLGVGAGSLLLLALVMVGVGHLLAPHFYLTRATFWGESDYRDLEQFSARTIDNARPPSTVSICCPQTTPTDRRIAPSRPISPFTYQPRLRHHFGSYPFSNSFVYAFGDVHQVPRRMYTSLAEHSHR
jgi:hypothetical protein